MSHAVHPGTLADSPGVLVSDNISLVRIDLNGAVLNEPIARYLVHGTYIVLYGRFSIEHSFRTSCFSNPSKTGR